MKKILAIRHVFFEDLGNFSVIFNELGYQIQYIDMGLVSKQQLAQLDVTSPELLIVLGAPIGVFDESLYPFITDELRWVIQRLNSGKPLLGICFGAQLIARVLGANVRAMGFKEIGFAKLELTSAGQQSVLSTIGSNEVLHWHGDMFDIPNEAVLLASSDKCPHQAFSYKNNVLALQFHLEANLKTIDQWLIGHACELFNAKVDIVAIREYAHQQHQHFNQLSQTFIKQWLANIAS